MSTCGASVGLLLIVLLCSAAVGDAVAEPGHDESISAATLTSSRLRWAGRHRLDLRRSSCLRHVDVVVCTIVAKGSYACTFLRCG